MMNEIITTSRELYAKTIADPSYALSHIWGAGSFNSVILEDIIYDCSTPEEVDQALAATDLYAISIPDDLTKVYMLDWYKKYLVKQGFEGDIPETPNLCRMLAICYHIQEHFEMLNSTIIELGGGNGQFAAMAKTFGNRLHIDIDIPESLYMAYVCTRMRFPDAKCQWILSEGDTIAPEAEFVFCPVNFAGIFKGKQFDLFLNTASMGELPNVTIKQWMNFVQQEIKVKYFYGLNRFLNTIETKNLSDYSVQRKNENLASVLFDGNWKVLLWELEPLMCRCPYQDPRIARYLEIMLERIDHRDDDPGVMGEIGMMDWWRYKDVNPLGTHRSNQLVHDYTKGGILYHLWNAIRIIPSKGAVEMMLTYLQWIGKESTQFEEEVYYQELKGQLK